MLDSGCSILIPAHDLFTILYGTRKINCIMYTFTVSMKYRGEYLWLYKNNRFHMYKHKSKSNLDAWQFKNKNKLYFRCFEQQFFCENIHFVGWVVVCYTVVMLGHGSASATRGGFTGLLYCSVNRMIIQFFKYPFRQVAYSYLSSNHPGGK